MDQKQRINVIDAFRGVAILTVLLYHYLVFRAPPFRAPGLYGYAHQYSPILGLGKFGVEVFFVISGLVIAMTLAQCRSAFEFAVKRFARLYPAYIAAATLTFLLMRAVGPSVFQSTFGDYLVGFSMISRDLHHGYVDGAYWSLAIEVKFYLFAAIGFALLRQNFWMIVVGIAILGAALAPIAPGISERILIAHDMPLFLFGMAAWLEILAHRRREAVITAIVATFLYAIHLEYFAPTAIPHWASHTFILGTSALMILLLKLAPGARLGPLAFVGRISYSLYLLHQYIGVTIITTLTARGAPDMVAFAVATVVLATLAWIFFRTVEEPGRKAVMAFYRRLRQPAGVVEPSQA
ncbi:MAG: acyltransferase [Proteobacteria bacterium]|nr:acyltransferase [Pseudomonadota bacterium]